MPIALQHEDGNLHRLEVSGVLRKGDLERCQAALLEHVRRSGGVRLLFVLQDFEGWDARDDWRDLTFYVQHGDAIERIAIVGDERWRSESLMFAGADLRKAPVEFFAADDVTGARAWLSA
jgi:SpoIIAA-like